MRWLVMMALVMGCKKDKDETEPPAGTGHTGEEGDADTDADADADTDADTDTDTDTDGGSAYMRVVHAAPGLSPLSLYVQPNPNAVLSNVQPVSGSGWGQVPTGMYDMLAGPTGGALGDEWATATVNLQPTKRYSLVLTGSADTARLVSFEENPAGLAMGSVRYALVNAGEFLAPFDLLDLTAGTVLGSGVTYGSAPTVADIPRSIWTAGVDLDRNGSADVQFAIPDVGGQVVVPLYFLVEGTDLVMIGHSPNGTDLVLRAPLPGLPGDTGSNDTGLDDTGTATDSAGDTGTATDTGDTSTAAVGPPTGDTQIATTGHTGNDGTADTGPDSVDSSPWSLPTGATANTGDTAIPDTGSTTDTSPMAVGHTATTGDTGP